MTDYVNPVFNLFTDEGVEDNSIHSMTKVRYVSENGYQLTNSQVPSHKIVVRDLESYHDYANAYLEVVYSYTLPDGTAILAQNTTGHANAMAIFSKIILSMNDVEICNTDEPVHSSTIRNLLEYSPDYATKFGQQQGFLLGDSAVRQTQVNLSFRIACLIPLSRMFGFFQDVKTLWRGLSLKLELQVEQNINKLVYGAGGAASTATKVVIHNLGLWVDKIVPSPSSENRYLSFVRDNNSSELIYNDYTSYVSPLFPANTTRVSYQIPTQSKKPRWFIVGFQNALRRDAKTELATNDPVRFDQFGLTSISLKLNGQIYPQEPYVVNYANSTALVPQDFNRPLSDLLGLFDKDREYDNGSLVSRDYYANYAPLYCFDLQNESSGVFENLSNSNIEVVADFSSATVTFYCIATACFSKSLLLQGGNNQLTIKRP